MANKSWLPAWGDRNRDVEHFGRFKGQVDSLFEDWFGRTMGACWRRAWMSPRTKRL